MAEGYLKTSWGDLRADTGWWRRLAVLALIQFIPVVGRMILLGYLFQWAREAAWGMRTPLSVRTDDVGRALRCGAMAFLVGLIGGLIIGAVDSLVAYVPYTHSTLSVVLIPLYLAAMMILLVMVMRCVLYDSLEPSVQIPQAFQMVRRDPVGLIHLCGISCLVIVPFLICAPAILGLYGLAALLVPGHVLGTLLFVLAAFVVTYLCLFAACTLDALAIRALGMWTSHFQPMTWGPSKAGVPQGVDPLGSSRGSANGA